MAAPNSVVPRHTESTGMISNRFFSFVGSWRNEVPSHYESEAEVLMPSFQPTKGSWTDVSTMAGRTTAMGKPAPYLEISDSARLLVRVYVLGHPSSAARFMPYSVKYSRSQ